MAVFLRAAHCRIPFHHQLRRDVTAGAPPKLHSKTLHHLAVMTAAFPPAMLSVQSILCQRR